MIQNYVYFYESIDENNTVYDSRDNCNAIIETATNTLILGFEPTIIPNSVTSIADRAFASRDSLTSITIPEGVTSIGEGAFYSCDNLTSITIPNSVTSIGRDAFAYCERLTSITIPEGVTIIGADTFRGCSSLKSITLPESITDIGDSAFRYCPNITSLTIKATTPPTFSSSYDFGSYKETIYVPAESVDKYKAANRWRDFRNKIQAIEE